LKSSISSSQTIKTHTLTELQGLGKEIWANVDANEYTSKERRTWS